MRCAIPALALMVPLLLLGACADARHPAIEGRPQPPPQAALPDPARPVDGSFVTSDGVRLHYTVAGSGPTMVFVPGWDMPGWIFAEQQAEFSRSYRTVLFDPRGQGSSDIPAHGYEPHRRGQDIAELIAHLQAAGDPGPAVLVGWSLGVLDVLATIADRGDASVAALVLVDNSVGEAPAPLPVRHPPPRRGHRPAPVPREVSMRAFVASMFRTKQDPAWLDRLTQAALRVPAPASAALLAYPVPRSFWFDAIYATHRPILYLVRPGLAGQAGNLAAHHPDARAVVLAGVGHAMFVDDPGRFDALVRSFLAERVYGTQ